MKQLVQLFFCLLVILLPVMWYYHWTLYNFFHKDSQKLLRSNPSSHPPLQGYVSIPNRQKMIMHCGQCALVSSSGQMLESQKGEEIDNAECVLRMNNAPTVGYETDVGKRTTLRMVSHTSVPLLLRNSNYYFNQSGETVYVIWGPNRQMNQNSNTNTYGRLAKAKQKYPSAQMYFLTEEKMAFCDKTFAIETGKDRVKSGSYLSTGWFTMILAMELCDDIQIYGMVNDSYCREKHHSKVPYHYYETNKVGECDVYNAHERAHKNAHRFITEKTVFARWAERRGHITFAYPSQS
ncbi:alpha-N-acetyl-neuraminyl-2,3-beta-galactosyl-1,3-N-acetyl-galactosaminide alpha-2,6-sialyltransferase isoform X2 [Protopterus annectens]|uniref:alpha-N-acetyl-neuraminyl-2,3-beta-galactosyl-1, 3-N-acetyl-galactosaminide alpha-2,6-sialyltransferase isoform X2 n=1 Tax=Protopterus annectens TaxID=7888 RepID=UPI001CFB45DA|nr:alpha-N-acetyl-neuraminyl-2,3-beta-galactosyl-1,3-N-acetyl-galactosaminide alpha-2,6-sialyltransferase isoform X2 [Protopterus annectens]